MPVLLATTNAASRSNIEIVVSLRTSNCMCPGQFKHCILSIAVDRPTARVLIATHYLFFLIEVLHGGPPVVRMGECGGDVA